MAIRKSLLCALISFSLPAFAQVPMSDSVAQQISDVLRMKHTLNPAQQKESSELIFAGKRARDESMGTASESLVRKLEAADGTVLVDIKTNANLRVERAILAAGGRVMSSFARDHAIRARIPVTSVDAIATESDVRWIRPADQSGTNFVGSVTSQGFIG